MNLHHPLAQALRWLGHRCVSMASSSVSSCCSAVTTGCADHSLFLCPSAHGVLGGFQGFGVWRVLPGCGLFAVLEQLWQALLWEPLGCSGRGGCVSLGSLAAPPSLLSLLGRGVVWCFLVVLLVPPRRPVTGIIFMSIVSTCVSSNSVFIVL